MGVVEFLFVIGLKSNILFDTFFFKPSGFRGKNIDRHSGVTSPFFCARDIKNFVLHIGGNICIFSDSTRKGIWVQKK